MGLLTAEQTADQSDYGTSQNADQDCSEEHLDLRTRCHGRADPFALQVELHYIPGCCKPGQVGAGERPGRPAHCGVTDPALVPAPSA